MFFSRAAGHKYIYRSNATDYDFKIGDFTIDSNWHILDLSSIVPKNAVAVSVYLRVNGLTPNARVYIRKNGQSDIYNIMCIAQPNGSQQIINNGIVAVDNNQCIQYKVDADTWNSISLTICGWFI